MRIYPFSVVIRKSQVLFMGCQLDIPGVHFQKSPFVPNISVYNYKVLSSALPPRHQLIPRLICLGNCLFKMYGRTSLALKKEWKPKMETIAGRVELGVVRTAWFSLAYPLAIKWLRDYVQRNKSVHFQVLVTGSLHLVGDELRIVKN